MPRAAAHGPTAHACMATRRTWARPAQLRSLDWLILARPDPAGQQPSRLRKTRPRTSLRSR
eukprot:12298423-Alexandrium_andersonii.AAC.1